MNPLLNIAKFINEFSYDSSLSKGLVTFKRSLIDSIGVTIAGSKESSVQSIHEIICVKNCSQTSTVIGRNFKTSSTDAALINGISLHVLDFDDTGAFTQGHPSATIIPAILAIAEEYEFVGIKILEAYTIAVEIQSILSRSMPMLHLKGWHPTSVFGTIGSASAISKLFNLNVEEISNAIGIAASMSSGLIKNFGTMTKALHVGNAASDGILAAKLAQKGFDANKEILNSEKSFQNVYGYENDSLIEMTKEIGSSLVVIDPGINIKKYPSCSMTHRLIDAVFSLKKKHNIIVDEIMLIECFVSPRALKTLIYNKPKTVLEAKFSIQFVIASALFYNKVDLSIFKDSIINNTNIKSIIRTINVSVHNNWKDGDDARGDEIILYFKNGVKLSEAIEIPSGNVKKPMSIEEIINKFKSNCKPYLNNSKQEKILEFVFEIEKKKNISELMNLLY